MSSRHFEEVELHKNGVKVDSDETNILPHNTEIAPFSDCLDSNQSEICTTPKALKPSSPYVKRWASVVKAQKSLSAELSVANIKRLGDGIEITTEILDCIFKTMPENFENHKGFITSIANVLFCNVCSLELESVTSLSNHLKTRKHEDNIIIFLKRKIPLDLHCNLEFVSFYDSNLCCNLCRCKISMSSQNPYETIVNIIAHNTSSHANRKASREALGNAHNLVKLMVSRNQEIKKNVHFIDKNMIPQFKCKLCNKYIQYDENLEKLIQNFISHLRSSGHVKNESAIETLKLFEDATSGCRDNFVVLNGNISCTHCDHEVDTDIEKLISHVNGVEHATNILSKLELSSNSNKILDNMLSSKENKVNEIKSEACYDKKKSEKTDQNNKKTICSKTRLDELLNSMPSGLKDIDYVIENENGSVTCLICNRVVPPSTYNLRTHLLGTNHRKNEELNNVKKNGKVSDKDSNNLTKTKESGPSKLNEHSTNKESISVKNQTKRIVNNKSLIKSEIDDYEVLGDQESENIEQQKKIKEKSFITCPKGVSHELNIINNVPKLLRVNKCHKIERIPSAIVNHLFSLILTRNSHILDNEDYLEKNIDGKHTYCKLCKHLLPLSLDLDTLESNITNHLNSKRHKIHFFEKQGKNEEVNNAKISNEKVARSLFNIQVKKEDAKLNEFLEISSGKSGVCQDENPFSIVTQSGIPFLKELSEVVKKKSDSDVFIFGKNEENKPKSKRLLVTKKLLLKNGEETDEEVLVRRQKQIDYGKNTEGYARYCKIVARNKRNSHQPETPPKSLKCSRRTWDGLIRVWRRNLHSWDPPLKPTSSLATDIQPLTTITSS